MQEIAYTQFPTNDFWQISYDFNVAESYSSKTHHVKRLPMNQYPERFQDFTSGLHLDTKKLHVFKGKGGSKDLQKLVISHDEILKHDSIKVIQQKAIEVEKLFNSAAERKKMLKSVISNVLKKDPLLIKK